MAKEIREYEINESVPKEDQHIGFIDMMLTWMGACIQPGAWTIGGSLAAVGFLGAFVIVLIANPIAYMILALIGYMAYKVGTTSMGLVRVPMGVRGSIFPTICNIINLYGWTAVSNFLAAITISYIFKAIFNTPAFGETGAAPILMIGCIINGLLSFIAISIGGSRTLKIFERIMMVTLLILSVWLTAVLFRTTSWEALVNWKIPSEMKIPFGIGMDAMLTTSLVWCTLIGDFTRYAKTKNTSTWSPVLGANFASIWFVLLGVLGVVSVAINTGVFDLNNANPSSMIVGMGLGWIALIIVIFSTVTTNMIDMYGASMNVMNIFPKIGFKKASTISGIITILVSWIPVFVGSFMNAFFGFMNILGVVFPPLLAIMVIDYYLIRKGEYDIKELDKVDGKYWYKNGINWYAVVSWLMGSICFIILRNVGFGSDSFGAVIPSILLSSVIYYVTAKLAIKNNAYKDIADKHMTV